MCGVRTVSNIGIRFDSYSVACAVWKCHRNSTLSISTILIFVCVPCMLTFENFQEQRINQNESIFDKMRRNLEDIGMEGDDASPSTNGDGAVAAFNDATTTMAQLPSSSRNPTAACTARAATLWRRDGTANDNSTPQIPKIPQPQPQPPVPPPPPDSSIPPQTQGGIAASLRLPGIGGAVIDCKNTLQSHSVMANFVDAAQSSAIVMYNRSHDNDSNSALTTGLSLDISNLSLSGNSKPSTEDPNNTMRNRDDSDGSAMNPHPVETMVAAQVIVEPGNNDDNVITNALPMQQAHGEVAVLESGSKGWCPLHRRRSLLFWSVAASFAASIAIVVATVLCADGKCLPEGTPESSTRPTTTATSPVPTMLPSPSPPILPLQNAPLVSRPNQVVAYINNITLSNQSLALLDSYAGIPEERALRWLIVDDPLELTPDTAVNRSRLRQRYALVTLWAQLSQSHPLFLKLESNECEWTGITCNVTSLGMESELGNWTVTGIEFLESSWSGRILPDLGLLSTLVSLNLTDTSLNGTLPHTIGLWTNLVSVALVDNQFTGSLPDSVGWWTKLMHFDFKRNHINGTLPDSIGEWTNLNSFMFQTETMEGSLPDSIVKWTSLKAFSVLGNDLIVRPPSETFVIEMITNFSQMEYSDAEYYGLSGQLPQSIGNWSLLRAFYAANNKFTGSLPGSIGMWTNLRFFDVSNNRLTGTLPESMENWTSILDVQFDDNGLEGVLPNQLCEAVNLTSLRMDCDNITCSCRSDICQC